MDNKGKKIYFDAAYVSNLIKKFKSKNKAIKIIMIVSILFFLMVSVYSFFNVVKINRYERYINSKIDLTVDNIVKDSVKIKYLIDKINGDFSVKKNYQDLMYSIKESENGYRDAFSILNVALEDVAPNKMVKFSEDFYLFVKNVYNKNSGTTVNLTDSEVNIFKNYGSFYNDVLFIQASTLFNKTPAQEDNLALFEVDLTDVNSVDSSFQSKYASGLDYKINNDVWITMLTKIQGKFVNNNIFNN